MVSFTCLAGSAFLMESRQPVVKVIKLYVPPSSSQRKQNFYKKKQNNIIVEPVFSNTIKWSPCIEQSMVKEFWIGESCLGGGKMTFVTDPSKRAGSEMLRELFSNCLTKIKQAVP